MRPFYFKKTTPSLTLITILLAITTWFPSNAQSIKEPRILDSLQFKIDSLLTPQDKINQYLKAWEVAKSINHQQAIAFAKKGMDLARESDDYDDMSTFLWQAGLSFQMLGEFDSAMHYIRQSVQVAEAHQLTQAKLTADHRLAALYYRMGNSDSARVIFQKVLAESVKNTFGKGEMLASSGLGKLAKREGDYEQALLYFMRELELAHTLDFPNSEAHALMNMGIIYGKMRDLSKAKSMSLEALSIASEIGDRDRTLQLYNNLAVMYRISGNYDSSLYFQQQSLSISRQIGNRGQVTLSYMNFGTTYAYQKKFDLAEKYYDSAYALAKNSKNIPQKMSLLQNLSAVNKDRGYFNESIRYARMALALSQTTKQTNTLPDLYENMYLSFKGLGMADSALFYHEQFLIYHDSLFNETKQKNIEELKIKYETQKNEGDMLDLENKSLEQSLALASKRILLNILYGTSFTVLVVLILLWILYRVKHRNTLIIKEKEIERLVREKEMNAAVALLSGQEEERKRIAQEIHDGIGVLLSSASLYLSQLNTSSTKEEVDVALQKAGEMIRQAADDVRKISHNMMPGVLSRFGLWDALEDLFEEVEEMGIVKVQYSRQGAKTRLAENTEVMVYRMMQELVNNTLKHAQASLIQANIQRANTTLTILYKDNGVGFHQDNLPKEKSLGLSGIYSRTEYLHGSIKIQSARGQGFYAQIDIPL